MAAVMQDDVAGHPALPVAIYLSNQAGGNAVRGRLAPVIGHGVPSDRGQAQFARDAQDNGPARAKRWAEDAYRLADYLGEGVAGGAEFLADTGRGGARKVGMAPGVIANEVTSVGDAADEGRFGLREFPDHEECCVHIVGGQDVEQLRRPRGVGAVVKSECQFVGALGRNERWPENL